MAGKLGSLPARSFRYATKNADGKPVTLTLHVLAGKDGCAALFVLGLDEKLKSREKEITAMLGSLRLEGQKAKKRAFGLGGGKKEDGAEPVPRSQVPAAKGDKPVAMRRSPSSRACRVARNSSGMVSPSMCPRIGARRPATMVQPDPHAKGFWREWGARRDLRAVR